MSRDSTAIQHALNDLVTTFATHGPRHPATDQAVTTYTKLLYEADYSMQETLDLLAKAVGVPPVPIDTLIDDLERHPEKLSRMMEDTMSALRLDQKLRIDAYNAKQQGEETQVLKPQSDDMVIATENFISAAAKTRDLREENTIQAGVILCTTIRKEAIPKDDLIRYLTAVIPDDIALDHNHNKTAMIHAIITGAYGNTTT